MLKLIERIARAVRRWVRPSTTSLKTPVRPWKDPLVTPTSPRPRLVWRKHPHPNIHNWELVRGQLRARVRPVRHHATLYVWTLLVTDEGKEEPFADLGLHYVEIAAGDSLAADDAEALAESKRDAQAAMRRATRCSDCDGGFDPLAQYVNYPGTPCETCMSSGWVTYLDDLPTGVALNP